ncbi:MAG TPA: response regulator [Burkholderiaceae bacterium]|nr:response regulator [Burkholderiaceae bacterium]
MPSLHSVCLLGYSDFERRALALQFRLAEGRTPGYTLVAAIDEARLLVVDGDAKSAVQRALDAGRLAHCIFVGVGATPKGALAHLRRPIDALSLLRELDAAILQMQGPVALGTPPRSAAPGTAPPIATAIAPKIATSRPPPRSAPVEQAAPPVASPDSQWSELADRFPDRAKPQAAASRCDALLVDDSEIALKFLELKLGELGLRSRSVTDSDAALEQLAHHDFNYVFLDVELGPLSKLDGLALCRRIKQRSSRPPVIAMVSAHASQTDRVRGSLAGCDAYLGKPLQPRDLLAVVGMRRGR